MKGITRSPALVVVFSIITCGIYYLYWLYKIADELRAYVQDPKINPGIDLLLSIICFPYAYYWMYKYGKVVAEAQKRAGLPSEDNSVLYLILAIFGLSIVGAAIMQSSMNKVWAQA